MPRKRSLLPAPSFTFRCGQGSLPSGPGSRGSLPLGYGPGDGRFSTLLDSYFPWEVPLARITIRCLCGPTVSIMGSFLHTGSWLTWCSYPQSQGFLRPE